MGVLKPLLCGCALWALSSLAYAAPTPPELEAVFLFNFSQFVDWPPQAFADASAPIVIGVLGSDPFGATLDEVVRGETVKGRALIVRRFRSIEDLTDCQILFVSRSERARLEPILQALKGRSVLTVSDFEDFAQEGGVICFVLVESKIRLRVNLGTARAAGLTLSSKLLRPAQIVGPGKD
jgi:YfiR/HmsC-like